MREGYLIKKLGSMPKGWSEEKMPDFAWFQEGPGLRKWQFTDKGIKVINITNMVNGVLDLSKTTRHISLEEFNSTYTHFECQENDIVIASSGNSYCKHAIVRKQDLPLVMNTSVIRFKPLSLINYNYLNQFLKSQLFKEQIDFMITGGAQPNFGPVHLKKVVLALPPQPEQQKIAEILSTVDAKIDLISQRISQTQDLKKGLMQRLLTKGIGHTEFKDSPLGEIPKSWDCKVLDDMGIELIDGDRGSNYPKSKDFSDEGFCLFLSAKNVTKKGFKFNECQFISKERDVLLRKGKLTKYDFVITTRGSVGHVAFYDDSIPFKHVRLNSGMVILRDSRKNYDAKFLYQFMKSPIFDSQVKFITSGSAQPQLTIKGLKKLKLPIPPLKEQLMIGDVLSTISNKIEVLQNKKNHYQDLKKGLMQQLLTGKVRVTGLIKEVV